MKRVAFIGEVGVSGGRMEKLADELIIEIMHHLPIFSEQHLKLVCKRWYGLISSAYLAQFFSQKKDRTFALFLHYDNTPHEGNFMAVEVSPCPTLKSMRNGQGLSLDFLPFDRNDYELPQVVAYWDDLFLCARGYYNPEEYEYMVCNPVTAQWVKLPSPPVVELASWQKPLMAYSWCEALIIRNQSQLYSDK